VRKTLIDKINEFENHQTWSVARFNEIFPECKLENLADNLTVEIGELADTDTTRFLQVGSLTVKHSFQPKQVDEISGYEVERKDGTIYTVGAHTRKAVPVVLERRYVKSKI
jgi:hypothetical protein